MQMVLLNVSAASVRRFKLLKILSKLKIRFGIFAFNASGLQREVQGLKFNA